MRFGRRTIDGLPAWSLVGLVSLVVFLFLISVVITVDRVNATQSLGTSANSSDTPISELATYVDRPATLWVGDSFTQSDAAYPKIVCAKLGWYCNIDAQGSTAFINSGALELHDTDRFIDRVATSAERYKADLIIIDGGRNDMSLDGADVSEAVGEYLEAVSNVWPDAKLAIIVPFRPEVEPSYSYSTFMPGIRDVADSFGATVLDPYTEGWFVGADISAMLIEDQLHPNARGNSYIAAKLEDSLKHAQVYLPGRLNGGLG